VNQDDSGLPPATWPPPTPSSDPLEVLKTRFSWHSFGAAFEIRRNRLRVGVGEAILRHWGLRTAAAGVRPVSKKCAVCKRDHPFGSPRQPSSRSVWRRITVLPTRRLVEPGVFVLVAHCRPHGAGQYNVDVFAARPDVVGCEPQPRALGRSGAGGFKSGPAGSAASDRCAKALSRRYRGRLGGNAAY
jgi:hypothetical protein